ncbi:MAG: glycoside hydrolase family 3 N-terminal domain-containing protein [Candidatus Zixiibacteriota bacterium]
MRQSFEIGQLFIVGYPGEYPSEEFLDFVEKENIGGVILFADNCHNHSRTRDAIDAIRSRCRDHQPFVAIDQEGGRVSRLKGAPAEILAAWEYGSRNHLERFAEDYGRSALYMESLGFNMNLAPVCDIFLDKNNVCLHGRCFGDTPERVAQFVQQSVAVSRRTGLISCLKHFPGLGAAEIDPHVRVAEASYDEMVWQQRERIPFAAGIDAGADMIMTTHVRLPKIDQQIVTGSSKIISSLIRRQLQFDGIVITDDLCMAGAEPLGSYGERTVAAFNAGHDILLFGQKLGASMEAYDYFCEAVERGEVNREQLQTAHQRVSGLKFSLRRTAIG